MEAPPYISTKTLLVAYMGQHYLLVDRHTCRMPLRSQVRILLLFNVLFLVGFDSTR